MEITLLQLEVQMVLTKPLENLLHVMVMVGQVPGVYEYIIDVKIHELMEEHLVHKTLEDRWGIGKADLHNKILIAAGRGDENRLPLITSPDTNEVVGTPQVQLGEDACPT